MHKSQKEHYVSISGWPEVFRSDQNRAGNRNERREGEETSEQREKLRRGAGECGSVWEDGGGQVICPMMSRYVTQSDRDRLSN